MGGGFLRASLAFHIPIHFFPHFRDKGHQLLSRFRDALFSGIIDAEASLRMALPPA